MGCRYSGADAASQHMQAYTPLGNCIALAVCTVRSTHALLPMALALALAGSYSSPNPNPPHLALAPALAGS